MKCKFEHDGDCCNSGATQYMCKCKQPCDTIIPITNADRIRAMSDELLATQLVQVFYEGVKALTSVELPAELLNEVRSHFLEKLEQPAEGD